MSSLRNTKCIGEKTFYQKLACNWLDGCLFVSIATLLIYLQCSDNIFGRGDISPDVLYALKKIADISLLIFFKIAAKDH